MNYMFTTHQPINLSLTLYPLSNIILGAHFTVFKTLKTHSSVERHITNYLWKRRSMFDNLFNTECYSRTLFLQHTFFMFINCV